MRMIDILVRIANNKLPDKTKFKIYSNSSTEALICEYDFSYPGTIWYIIDGKITSNYKIDYMRILSYKVEIIEDKNIKEIEIINNIGNCYIVKDGKQCQLNRHDTVVIDKINELVREINKLKN